MLESAAEILEASERVSAVLTPAQEAWKLVADAAKLSDRAALADDTHTRSGVTTSSRLTEAGIEEAGRSRREARERAASAP